MTDFSGNWISAFNVDSCTSIFKSPSINSFPEDLEWKSINVSILSKKGKNQPLRMKCTACYTPYVKVRIQEKKLPHSCMVVANRNNDTARDSLENFKSRVKRRFRKVMLAGEQGQET